MLSTNTMNSTDIISSKRNLQEKANNIIKQEKYIHTKDKVLSVDYSSNERMPVHKSESYLSDTIHTKINGNSNNSYLHNDLFISHIYKELTQNTNNSSIPIKNKSSNYSTHLFDIITKVYDDITIIPYNNILIPGTEDINFEKIISKSSCDDTCESNCNSHKPRSKSGCYCDHRCLILSDCCPDYEHYCVIPSNNRTGITDKWADVRTRHESRLACRPYTLVTLESQIISHISVVAKCPKDNVSEYSLACEGNGNKTGEWFISHLLAQSDDIIFANAYCAICNGYSNYTTSIYILTCGNKKYNASIIFKRNKSAYDAYISNGTYGFEQYLEDNRCDFHYDIGLVVVDRRQICDNIYPRAIRGLMNKTNGGDMKYACAMCSRYTSEVGHSSSVLLRYPNPHCALCINESISITKHISMYNKGDIPLYTNICTLPKLNIIDKEITDVKPSWSPLFIIELKGVSDYKVILNMGIRWGCTFDELYGIVKSQRCNTMPCDPGEVMISGKGCIQLGQLVKIRQLLDIQMDDAKNSYIKNNIIANISEKSASENHFEQVAVPNITIIVIKPPSTKYVEITVLYSIATTNSISEHYHNLTESVKCDTLLNPLIKEVLELRRHNNYATQMKDELCFSLILFNMIFSKIIKLEPYTDGDIITLNHIPDQIGIHSPVCKMGKRKLIDKFDWIEKDNTSQLFMKIKASSQYIYSTNYIPLVYYSADILHPYLNEFNNNTAINFDEDDNTSTNETLSLPMDTRYNTKRPCEEECRLEFVTCKYTIIF